VAAAVEEAAAEFCSEREFLSRENPLHSKGTVELCTQTKPTEVSCADTQFATQIVYGTATLYK
jgi:hypothetical protein